MVARYSAKGFVEAERTAEGHLAPTAVLLLKNKRCPWRCVYCDLWKDALDEAVPAGEIPAQIHAALASLSVPADRRGHQVKLYNAGSFFDRAAIPPSDFPAIAEQVRGFSRVIVESHPALIGPDALRFRNLIAPAKLEIAMGLEIADDHILKKLNKRMTLAMYRRAAAFLRDNRIASRAFVIVKPPLVRTQQEALDHAIASVAFAFDCAATAVALIPGRFGPDALTELAKTGDFSPPTLATFESAFDAALGLGRGRIFADLWDIAAVSHCADCAPARHERLAKMNTYQQVFPRVGCPSDL